MSGNSSDCRVAVRDDVPNRDGGDFFFRFATNVDHMITTASTTHIAHATQAIAVVRGLLQFMFFVSFTVFQQ
jgi:hypothetical protein